MLLTTYVNVIAFVRSKRERNLNKKNFFLNSSTMVNN